MINIDGQVVVPFQYIDIDYSRLFYSKLIAVENDDEKWGYINLNNEVVIPFIYDRAYNFAPNGLAVVAKENAAGDWMYGCIDTMGNERIPLKYTDMATIFTGETIAASNTSENWGSIDTNGNIKLPFKYRSLQGMDDSGKYYKFRDFDESRQIEVYGIIDENGNEVLPAQYSMIRNAIVDSDESCIGFYVDITKEGVDKHGVLSNEGETIVPIECDRLLLEGDSKWILAFMLDSNDSHADLDSCSTLIYYDLFGNESLNLSGKYRFARGLRRIDSKGPSKANMVDAGDIEKSEEKK